MEFLKYWHTLRHLKPIQVTDRIGRHIWKPRLNHLHLPRTPRKCGAWVNGIEKAPSLLGPRLFSFLNETRRVENPGDWNHPYWDKLWLYNLHYFDELNARAALERTGLHLEWIERWIRENPPAAGNGWEPYPISLRIVNWIKWVLKGQEPTGAMVGSLALQARWLRRRLEYHLLGNHLFANLKALVFAGCFFQGTEAEEWLAKGLDGIRDELREQVLPDGGHFERSPMYHAIIFEDVLDLINVTDTCRDAVPGRFSAILDDLRDTAQKMLQWLQHLTHPDGEIALLNDAALKIAPNPGELLDYARRLSIPLPSGPALPLVHLPQTGYIRIEKPPCTAFLDVAPIGPDHLPGHAHADTLTFELSFHGQRFIVDSGISCYGVSAERLRQRSTTAHNTVEIDGENSSEVWGGFRVARRAYPQNLEIVENPGAEILVRCSHDGYTRLPGKPVHRREWKFSDRGFCVTDFIAGRFTRAVSRFHFHPQIHVECEGENKGHCALPDGKKIRWSVEGGKAEVTASTYHPEFGVGLPNRCLEIHFHENKTCFSADM